MNRCCRFCGSTTYEQVVSPGVHWRIRVARLFDHPDVTVDERQWLRWTIAWKKLAPRYLAQLDEIEARVAAVGAETETNELENADA